jgi:hypothetical protein
MIAQTRAWKKNIDGQNHCNGADPRTLLVLHTVLYMHNNQYFKKKLRCNSPSIPSGSGGTDPGDVTGL